MRRPEIVERIKGAVHKTDPQATVILYGSEARGDARSDSDIDLLVLVDEDKMTWAIKDKFLSPLFNIELETGTTISPTIMLRKNWENRPFKTPFYINVVNEGFKL
ncbi:MAG: nucleotidyltransferase domain-containing protein [Prevotella sp.]|nr:nucleotidyltransferase domain-containing protein [Prevotella sp.]